MRSRVGLAEDVVEDLERQRAVVAGGEHVLDEAGEVEAALAGEAAVVAAPLQDVHRQARRVGELEEEDPLAGDVADRRRGRCPRERMWKESRQVPSAGWSAARDDPPGVVVVADVAAPGERLVGDAQAALGGALARARAAARPRARRRRSRPGETLEQTSSVGAPSSSMSVELGLGAAQVARERRGGTASKSRNGW